MKKLAGLLLVLVMFSVLGCEKKETYSITGPSGQTAGVTVNK